MNGKREAAASRADSSWSKERYLVGPDEQSGACRAHTEELQHERPAVEELAGENAAIFHGQEVEVLREDEGEKQRAANRNRGGKAAIGPGPLLAAEDERNHIGGIPGRNK